MFCIIIRSFGNSYSLTINDFKAGREQTIDKNLTTLNKNPPATRHYNTIHCRVINRIYIYIYIYLYTYIHRYIHIHTYIHSYTHQIQPYKISPHSTHLHPLR